jgi:hypothetical protein
MVAQAPGAKDKQYSNGAGIIEKARKATAANASTKLGRRKLP